MKNNKWRNLSATGILVLTVGIGVFVYLPASHFTAVGAEDNSAPSSERLNALYQGQTSEGPHTAAQADSSTDVVVRWNQKAAELTLSANPAMAPVEQTRFMAIVQVAVHDAVNGITREFETYLSPGSAPENATPAAAAIAAADHVLRNRFTSAAKIAELDALYLQTLSDNGLTADDPGIDYGRAAAAAIMSARNDDGASTAQYEYTPPDAGQPGAWIRLNNAAALLPGWGSVRPFVMRSGSQFRPDAPPALDSEQYAKDYNEIKAIGRSTGSTRTTLQTQIASFWRASPTAIWNPVMTQVLVTRDLDISSAARAYALFYLASADASIACWETKYHYNFWRPQLAIRGGDVDGNDLTEADPLWTPLFATPPHPEYSSGHTTNSGSMAFVLEDLFGRDPGMTIEVTLGGITRQWATFDEAMDEVIDARIFSGLHFRTADEVGARQGRQVAQFVLTHALRPCKGKGNRC